MKEYELTIRVHPELEVDLKAPIAKVRDIITSNGGKIIKEEIWGKKKLAYKIKKEDFAIYVYFDVSLSADVPLKISNILNITDDILRYLLVTVDEKSRKVQEEAKLNTSNGDVAEKE